MIKVIYIYIESEEAKPVKLKRNSINYMENSGMDMYNI